MTASQQAQKAIIHTGAGGQSVLKGDLQGKEGFDRANGMAEVGWHI